MPGPVGENSLRRPPFELRPSMQRCARVYGAEARNVLASAYSAHREHGFQAIVNAV